MKQIELYLSLNDYFNSIKNRDHSVMNVSQVGDVGEEEYRYDRVVITNETNPVLLSIAISAGWNYTFPDKVTLQELSMLSMDDIINNIAGNTALTNFDEFQYCTSIGLITNDMFSGCSSLASIVVPQTVSAAVADAFATCSPNIQVTYLNPDVEIISGALKRIRASYNIPNVSRWDTSKRLFYADENLANSALLAVLSNFNETAEKKLDNPIYKTGFKPVVGDNRIDFEEEGSGGMNGYNFEFDFVLYLKEGNTIIPNSFMTDSYTYGVGLTGCLELPDTITSIGTEAFRYNTGLTSIVFENGGKNIERIDDKAFEYCQGIENFTVPENVTFIGDRAFSCCHSLTSITIGNKVESLGAYCFSACSAMTEITIPSGVTELKNRCFAGCKSLTNVNISGNSLKNIGPYCFQSASSLTSFTIPDSVTSVSSGCFIYCSSLKSLTIGSGVNEFKAFNYITSGYYGCNALTSITINEGCRILWDSAFNYLKIKTVNLPSTIIYFGAAAFSSCDSLTAVTIPSNTIYVGRRCFANCKSLTSLVFPTNVYILDSGVCENCTSLTSVTIPNGAAYIYTSAFSNCISLKSIDLPDTIREIGTYAFGRCLSLTSITIPESVSAISYSSFTECYVNEFINNSKYTTSSTYWGATLLTSDYSVSNGFIIKDNNIIAYRGNLTNLIIPDGITGVSSSAFQSYDIISVSFPSTIKEIGNYAFYHCNKLTSLTIPNTIETVGAYAFSYCSKLTDLVIGSGVTYFGDSVFYECTSLTSVTLTEGLTTLGSNMFRGYDSYYYQDEYCPFSSITIPSSVTGIPESCFSFVKNLSAITFMGDFDHMTIDRFAFSGTPFLQLCGRTTNSITYIGNVAYRVYSTGNTSYTLKEGTTSIAGGCFSGCSKMTGLTIPNSVTNIGSYAFADASAMTSLVIPSSITEIRDYTFMTCKSLANLELPNTIEKIGNYAFYSCATLSSITLPENVIKIGNKAFASCTSLISFSFGQNNNPLKLHGGLFRECRSLTGITFPRNIIEISHDDFWDKMFYACSALTTIVFEGADTKIYERGNNGFFSDLPSLTSVTLPSNLTEIPYGMFARSGLQTITLPASLTGISDYAFSGSAITSITLPGTLKTIGRDAFGACNNLTGLAIPNSVTSIGNNFIYSCTSLTNLSFGSGITTLPDVNSWCVFQSLTSITAPDTITGYSGDDCEWISKAPFVVCGYCQSDGGIYYLNNKIALKCTSTGLTEYTFKETTTAINGSCCGGCKIMTALTIPSSVKIIGRNAFGKCTGLREVTFNCPVSSITEDGYGYLVRSFIGCDNIEYVRGPYATSDNKMIISNGTLAFIAKKNLTSLVIPSSVTFVPGDLCSGITSLTSVTFPSSVTTLGKYAFEYCSNLKTVTFESPNNIQEIPNGCFENCSKLTGISIPNSVVRIGEFAFYKCAALNQANLSNNLEIIDRWAFSNDKALTTIDLPDSLKLVSEQSFYGTGLVTVRFPKKSYFGYEPFGECTSLTSITFGQDCELAILPYRLFYSCTSLTNVTIPNCVRELRGTFSSCKALTGVNFDVSNSRLYWLDSTFEYTPITNISLPEKLVKLASYTFRGDSQLTAITFNCPIEPKIDSYSFNEIPGEGNFYYPVNGYYKNMLDPNYSYGLTAKGWTGQEMS